MQLRVIKKCLAVLLFAAMMLGTVLMNVGAASYEDTGPKQETESEEKTAGQAADTEAADKGGKAGIENEQLDAVQETGRETEKETKPAESQKTDAQTEKGNGQETEKKAQKETEKKNTQKNYSDSDKTQKKAQPASSGTENTEGVKSEGKSAGAVLDSSDNLQLAALVPDPNFRKAIYDSLSAYGWLNGDPENPPQSMQEILETYTGPITGRGDNKPDAEKIQSIDGIQYFKMATTGDVDYIIDLRFNSISDITPITDVCTAEQYHYGYRRLLPSFRYEGAPVRINLVDNPIRCVPNTENTSRKLGYLEFTSLKEASPVYAEDPHYYFKREEAEVFSDYMRIGYCQYDQISEDSEYIPVTSLKISSSSNENDFLKLERTDQWVHKNSNVDARIYNITKSGVYQFDLASEQCFDLVGINKTGVELKGPVVMGYSLFPIISIFDKVSMDSEYSGRAQLQKVDRLTGNPINGAVYNFYRRGENGQDQLLLENLETQTRKVTILDEETGQYVEKELPGYTDIIENLAPGTYYFKETGAPTGYEVDEQEIEVVVNHVLPYISGGEKELDYTSANGEKIQGTSKDNETYVTWNIGKKTHLFLGNENKDEYGDEMEDTAVREVKVTYRSLDGSKDSVTESYGTLQKAENALNDYVSRSYITGYVKIQVIYEKSSAPVLKRVKAQDEPLYTKVHVQKTWVGLSGNEVLPEVTYRLLRNIEGSEEKTEINRWTVPEGSKEEDYSHSFEKDADGNLLRQYVTDTQGNTFRYEYTIEELCDSDEYLLGTPGEPQDLIFETTLEDGKKDEGVNLITIPVSNYKKASIKLSKVDAADSSRKLSGVEFKLEKKEGEIWKEIDAKTTNKEGEVLYENLGSGDYRITETKTQPGYILLKDPILVTIGDLTDDGYQRELEYTVENSRSHRLPVTGGPGNEMIMIAGMLLVLAACMMWIRKIKLNRK